MGKRTERIGAKGKNRFGSEMEVIEYKDAKNIVVRFIETGYTVSTDWNSFNKGNVKHVYDKSSYGVGFIGEGDYLGGKAPQYVKWRSMLNRCYNSNRAGYSDCYVDEEWHNYQNFAKWYDENYYEINEETMELDKDILFVGNRVYSKDTCVFVPLRINSLFQRKATRDGLPIGVYFDRAKGKYRAKCNIDGKDTFLGRYETAEEAFQAYKTAKEKYIKKVAEEYRGKVPEKLYKAMRKYEVRKDV